MPAEGSGRWLARLRRASAALPPPVRSGVGWGIALATIYTGWVTLVRLAAGRTPFESLGTSWLEAALVYYAGGIVGGALVGVLWRIQRSPIGAVILGTTALYPIFLWITFAHDELSSVESLVLAALMSLLVGGINGFLWWWQERKP